MNKKIKLFLLTIICVMFFSLAACESTGNDDNFNPPYTVSFESNGGTIIQPQVVEEKGETIELSIPEKEGYVFHGWFMERGCINEFTEETPVRKDLVLYAKWTVGHEISTLEELFNIQNDLSADYYLVNDIDCQGLPIPTFGDIDNPFTGTINGQGYALINFKLSISNNIGLVGYNQGTIKNLVIKDTVIDLTESYSAEEVCTAAFVGRNEGTIENCAAINVTVKNTSKTLSSGNWTYITAHKTGIITGINKGTVKNCYVQGNVESYSDNLCKKVYQRAGGVTAQNEGLIENCFVAYAFGDAFANFDRYSLGESGGVSAVNQETGIIKNCVVLGKFTSNYHSGDICSRNSGIIENSYKSEHVEGSFYYVHGVALTNEELENESFYELVLSWDEYIWNYSVLDFDSKIYPTLKFE